MNPGIVPYIIDVSPISTSASQVIIIMGSGFGKQASYQQEDSEYIRISDKTGDWNAGYKPEGNLVSLSVSSWTDSKIVVTGFGRAYGSNGWLLHPGDNIEIDIWSAKDGSQPAVFKTGEMQSDARQS